MYDRRMKQRGTVWLAIGVILLILGVASFFVPVPRRESHGFRAGEVEIGVSTTTRETLPPAVSAALIVAGAVLLAVGARKR